jgi:thioredoxin-related protein
MTILKFVRLVALAACAGTAAAAEPLLAAPYDLRAEAGQAVVGGNPLVLMFSLPDCQYCAVVRRNYLAPLTRAPRPEDRLVVREVELTGSAPLAGFQGEQTSGRMLAARYGVRVAPAVVMLDGAGRLLAEPLLGGDVAGMYGAYLDRALGDARAKLAAHPIHPKP